MLWGLSFPLVERLISPRTTRLSPFFSLPPSFLAGPCSRACLASSLSIPHPFLRSPPLPPHRRFCPLFDGADFFFSKPLGLSSFTIDDYEQSLYHNENWTPPPPLMVEIHATLLNALIRDLALGHEAARPVSNASVSGNDDIDYWEGKKGATTDTLRPVAGSMAEQWQSRELSIKDSRKGWEAALVGCLWERATLETLPNYLDNILHLTFEDKPAPTRPTWSTGPSQASGHGLVPTKPEKRYTSLHHLHKLDIITFLIELVSQTAAVRDFMEDSTAALTEVRKDQVEAKREWKRM